MIPQCSVSAPLSTRNDADSNDKPEIFRQLGLKLTYHPGRRIVEAQSLARRVVTGQGGFLDPFRWLSGLNAAGH
jgi:hypothetical protein